MNKLEPCFEIYRRDLNIFLTYTCLGEFETDPYRPTDQHTPEPQSSVINQTDRQTRGQKSRYLSSEGGPSHTTVAVLAQVHASCEPASPNDSSCSEILRACGENLTSLESEQSDVFYDNTDAGSNPVHTNQKDGAGSSLCTNSESFANPNLSPLSLKFKNYITAMASAAVTDKNSALAVVVRAKIDWTDDFEGYDLDTLPIQEIENRINQAKKTKDLLTDVEVMICVDPSLAAAFPEGLDGVSNIKRQYVQYLKSAFPKLTERKSVSPTQLNSRPVSAASTVADEIQMERVERRTDSIVEEAEIVTGHFDQIPSVPATSHVEIMDIEARLESCKGERRDLLAELKDLIKIATKSGMRTHVERLNDVTDDLNRAARLATASVAEKRRLLGIPAGSTIKSGNINLPPPKFEGDFLKGPDFFTFKSSFNEYTRTVGLHSDPDKLLRLRTDCLSGQALEVVTTSETFTEAMDNLNRLYGKPNLLFCGKERDIGNLGKCPTGILERRAWLLSLYNKLVALRKLSDNHNIRDDYDNSSIFSTVIKNMTDKDREDYDKQCIDAMALDGKLDMSRRAKAQRLVQFLNTLCERATLQLDHSLTGLSHSDDVFKSLKTTGAGSDKKDRHKPTEKPKQFEKKGKDSQRGAFQHTQGEQRERERGNKPLKTYPKPDMSLPIPDQEKRAPTLIKCLHCNNQHTHLSECKKFEECETKGRWGMLCKVGACYICLRMDAAYIPGRRKDWFEKHQINCNNQFICSHKKCGENPQFKKTHILLCSFHSKENTGEYEKFLKTLPSDKKYKFFIAQQGSQNIYSGATSDEDTPPIYMIHTITTKAGRELQIFYDSGCSIGAVSTTAVEALGAKPLGNGPIPLTVAGGRTIWNKYGDASFSLKTTDGNSTEFTMLQMDTISVPFPVWELKKAWNALCKGAMEQGMEIKSLPTPPKKVGGREVDVMFGIKYLAFHPTPVLTLPSGLTLFKSKLHCPSNQMGIIGGPQPAWERTRTAVSTMGASQYLAAEIRAVVATDRALRGPDIPTFISDDPCDHEWYETTTWTECEQDLPEYENKPAAMCFKLAVRSMRDFQMEDDIGSLIQYRCVQCRNCGKCKKGEELELKSLQEETEQELIENSVELKVSEKAVYSKLPFIFNPKMKLTDNRKVAEKILQSQLNQIAKKPGMKEDIEKAHAKLADKHYVIPVTDLPEKLQKDVLGSGYYIPWRVVYNEGSLSTPCRIVFDASAKCPGGESLNEILAKGANVLARLLHLLIQFRCGTAAFAADVSMAYNAVKLHPDYYKFQKYLWNPSLDDVSRAVVMIIVTLIYGVRPSGNLTIAAFDAIVKFAREAGGVMALGAEALSKKAYMDDIFSSHLSVEERDKTAIGLTEALDVGSMTVKAITKSGYAPGEKVSVDGETVGLVGYIWRPEEDTLALDVKPIALGKAKRGVRPPPVDGDLKLELSKNFTKRVVAGQVASVFDPLGLGVPVTSWLKVDMSNICKLHPGWDEMLPEELLDTWVQNLERVQGLAALRVPRDACPGASQKGKIQLIATSDASQEVAVAAVYARTQLENGEVVVNLIAAKSKLVHKLTIPRGELTAAVMSATLTQIIAANFPDLIEDTIYCIDSSIVLHWIHQDQRPLQTAVRNGVIEIRRLSKLENWFFVPGIENPADIGTRRVAVEEITGKSDWLTGKAWMKGKREDMPLQGIEEIRLTAEEKREACMEIRNMENRGLILYSTIQRANTAIQIYEFIINPADKPWDKLLRALEVLIRCGEIWKTYKKGAENPKGFPVVNGTIVPVLNGDENKTAKQYIFSRTSRELKETVDKKQWENLGAWDGDIFYYTGRILDCSKEDSLAGAAMDLLPRTFSNPVISKESQVARSIMRYSHETLTHHGTAAATLRRSLEIAYILHGRALAIEVRKTCHYCNRYKARMIQAEMGRTHENRLYPAPAFYLTQVDLFGPFEAHCEHNHRAVVQIYGVVFKCTASMAVWVEIMQKYDTEAFLQAYTRFISRFAHPGQLLIDQGSQLVAACKKAKISFTDLAKGINGRYGVGIEYTICPTGSHEAQGQVERSIKEIRKLFDVLFRGLKLDIVSYATAFAYISAELNSLPIGLGTRYQDLDNLDLLTPARLILGRNISRAPQGLVEVARPQRLLDQLNSVYDAWWKVWDTEWIVNLIPSGQKWTKGNPDIAPGMIVIMKKGGKDAALGKTPYRIGRVIQTHKSKDGIIRSADIEYKNAGENKFRTTTRSVRTLAPLRLEEEMYFPPRLSRSCEAAKKHEMQFISRVKVNKLGSLAKCALCTFSQ